MEPTTWQVEYEELAPRLQRLQQEIVHALQQEIEQSKIKIHSLDSRVKSVTSASEKIERKGGKISVKELNDLVGARVVCLFLSDLRDLTRIVEDAFEIVEEDNKLDSPDPSTFGYFSLHYICQLPKTFAGPRYAGLHGIPFEIQLRTIAMDAWANISHYLDYKSDEEIPRDLRRDFHAISGLFYVADTHFEMFYKSRAAKRKEITKEIDKDPSKVELTLDSLQAYLRKRFPERKVGPAPSLLLADLHEYGYKDLLSLDRDMIRSKEAFDAYEREVYRRPGHFSDVGAVRVSAGLIHEKIKSEKYRKLIRPA